MGLTLLAHAHLPQKFWDFSFETAIYLINYLPTRSLDFLSPYQVLHGSTPNYSFLHVFGCRCFPYLRPYISHKLQFRSQPCHFLGYPPNFLGYPCLDLTTSRMFIARIVAFDKQHFPYTSVVTASTASSGSLEGSPVSSTVSTSTTSTSLPLPPSILDSSLSVSPPSVPSTVTDMLVQDSPLAPVSDVMPANPPARTHRMITWAQDGSLPPRRFSISKHPTAFIVASIA